MKLTPLIALALLLACSQAYATEKMYGALGVSYSDTEFNHQDGDGVGYSLAVGHQFDPQWYVEGGFMQLLDEQSASDGYKADVLYLAVLGKASSIQGELYYKLGIAKADLLGRENALETGGCRLGERQEARCRFDESVAAAMLGLGYDYNLGMRSMLRLEYTYLIGEHDFQAHVATFSFRYNFN